MQYLLAVIHEERNMADVDPAVMEKAYKDVDAFNNELKDAGAWVYANGLQPPSTAVTITMENGEPKTTDGPRIQSKEQLGGFWVIEAKSQDEAMSWALKGARACNETVEVRPFQDMPV